MPDAALRDVVLKRLDAAAGNDNEWRPLVLAALEGQGELQRQLDDGAAKTATGTTAVAIATATAAAAAPPRIAFLRSLTVEGFRGIGPKATLDLTPGPGLTLVVGRNGCGKSSFAEALELLLTGETYRWKDRSKVWKEGCRNLHHARTAIHAASRDRGRGGRLHGRPRVERRRRRSTRPRAGCSFRAGRARRSHALGWERGAREPPAVPLLQRARLDARRRARRSSTTRSRRSSASTTWSTRRTRCRRNAKHDKGRSRTRRRTDVAAPGAAGRDRPTRA